MEVSCGDLGTELRLHWSRELGQDRAPNFQEAELRRLPPDPQFGRCCHLAQAAPSPAPANRSDPPSSSSDPHAETARPRTCVARSLAGRGREPPTAATLSACKRTGVARRSPSISRALQEGSAEQRRRDRDASEEVANATKPCTPRPPPDSHLEAFAGILGRRHFLARCTAEGWSQALCKAAAPPPPVVCVLLNPQQPGELPSTNC